MREIIRFCNVLDLNNVGKCLFRVKGKWAIKLKDVVVKVEGL